MKKICNLILVTMLVLAFSGCSSKPKNPLEEEVQKWEQEVEKIFERGENISEEDVQEAIYYIHDHIDDVKDSDVAKNLVKYGKYLEEAAKEGIENSDVDLEKLGKKAKELASDVYTADEEDKDKIIDQAQSLFDDWSSSFHDIENAIKDALHNE